MKCKLCLLFTVLTAALPAVASVTVSSPVNGATVGTQVQYTATANAGSCSKGVASMGVYVNNKLAYVVNAAQLNHQITLSPGTNYTVVQEWDNCGGASKTPVNLNVASQSGVVVSAPTNGSTVSSPVHFAATASSACSAGVAAMGIYVANKLVYTVNGSSLNTNLSLGTGAQQAVVQDWDNCGKSSTVPVSVNVSNNAGVTVAAPAQGATVSSPVNFAASATSACAKGVAAMGIYVANKLIYTVNGSQLNTNISLASGSQQVVVQDWDNCGGASTEPVSVNVQGAATTTPGKVNVTTWHMDGNRSGLNANETLLNPSNVNASSFGKLFSYLVDGYVYAEPLLMSNLTVNGASHNVVFAATEHDSVYAFDADNYGSGAPLWQVSLLKSGESPMTNGPIQPYQGITSTPAIDPATGTMYVVSTQVVSGGGATFRLNALDITTGAQKFGGPVTIQASVPGSNEDAVNGRVSLTTACVQRAALLVANGNVYIGFGGCHSGWLLAYNASTLAQVGVFNSSPNLNGEGPYASAGGVWMGGAGPAVDSNGNIYITTGNGPWDAKTAFADSILKFSPTLQLEDYFTPSGYAYMNCSDADLGAGGIVLIPGTSEALAGGKTGKLYLVNTNNLGKEQANDAGATQTLWFEAQLSDPYPNTCTDSSGSHTEMINSYENFGTAAYFNGSAYVGVTPTSPNTPAGIGQFVYGGKLTPGQYTTPSVQENSRGTTPFISADGGSNGILWMIDHGIPLQESGTTIATLRAYDAQNLNTELYNSSTNTSDRPGYGIKFSSPIEANGKVYFATGHDPVSTTNPRGELDVYGLK
jgi:hypothetical protein